MERIPIPRLCGEYRHIYIPSPDVYRGRDTASFKNGVLYENWITNDFSIIKVGGRYHLVGITHPAPPDYKDEYTPTKQYIHEAEEMLFHAHADGDDLSVLMYDGSFVDGEKLLYPQDRPDEMPEIHAPHLSNTLDGRVRMIYGPRDIRLALTDDFKSFERRVLFVDHPTARDPHLFEENGSFTLIYAVENRIDYRQSSDLVSFTEPETLQVNPYSNEDGVTAASESPFLFKYKDFYYLFWAIYDARLGMYDHRTFVYGARTLEGLRNSAPLTVLPAHAGEIYEDESGIYLLSAFYPENGVNAVRIEFDDNY